MSRNNKCYVLIEVYTASAHPMCPDDWMWGSLFTRMLCDLRQGSYIKMMKIFDGDGNELKVKSHKTTKV